MGVNCTFVPSFFVASSKIALVNSLPLSDVMVARHPKIGIHLSVRASVTESAVLSINGPPPENMWCDP